MARFTTYQDFSRLAVEMEHAGAWKQAEMAWEKAAIVARNPLNEE